ncbi:isoprenylcysteine carboxylmethyltransferase family protein [soil metagenome]|jgi:protein-S-isoprenylcysteine O-methyltransferase Ste14
MKWPVGRAVLAFVALPGVVAFIVPWLVLARRRPDGPFDLWGIIPFAVGTGLLLWCVRIFYREGRGTLAPWDPPRRLVVSSVYRLSRNPMYVGVVLVLWGWALGCRSRSLAVYALAVMVAFHLRVVFGEEPWLARTHGEQWTRYKARVPRWLGIPRETSSRGRKS